MAVLTGLIGRDREIAVAEGVFESLSEEPGAIAIAGEPGIGKTSLLTELCDRADERGYLVLNGRGAEFERELPFGAFADALDAYLAAQGARHFDGLGPEPLGELAQVFPSLSGLGDPPAGPQDERYRTHAAVRELLELLSAGKPLMLALDDLHWADAASMELIVNLLRRPPDGPVCFLLAHRSGQLEPQLAAAIGDAERDGFLTSIEVTGLSREEAESLLVSLDPADREELYRLSGGNPFYLEELARTTGNGVPESSNGNGAGTVEVPGRVASALAQELGSLSRVDGELARGAAIAGETFEPELAAEAASISEAEALAAIDELLDLDVIRTTDVPRRFRFRHPIVHSAVYGSAKPGWRLAAHARVAKVLERQGASPLARARHIECSAKPGDQEAIALLTEAGQAAHPRAPAAAAHWYGAALRLIPDGDPGPRLGLMVPMAQALGYAGRLDEARTALDEILELIDPDQLAVRGKVVASAAQIDQLLGNHAAARDGLEAALNEMPESAEATELKLQLAGACFFTGDFDGLRRWIAEALDEARARGDRATEATATGTLGCAEYMVDDLDAARARLDEAEKLLERIDDEQIAGRLHSMVWCGITEIYLERFDRATRLLDRAMSVAQATGHGHVTTLARIGRSLVALWRGELEPAAELLDAAAQQALLTSNDQFLTWALWGRCWGATLAGDIPAALRFGHQSVEAAGGAKDPISAFAACHLAEARLEAGEDARACRDEVIEAVGGPHMPLVEKGFKSRWYELLTRLDLAVGDVASASNWAGLATEAAEGLGLDGRSSEALRAQAAVALARDDFEAAAEAALSAAVLAKRSGLPIDDGRARMIAGRALVSADNGEAIRQFEHARAQFDAVGANRLRDEAASQLRALGRRVTRPKRARGSIGEGVGSLSTREREVAGLVAQGHTNKEIAADLYLSEKTVESHLSRIFGKLGASKRAQVAAAIERDREPATG
jgi:DNA-binding CsgD family transcriptional regulator/tetratricopeptide (TPR) repeat protein